MLSKHLDRIVVLKYTDDEWYSNETVIHKGKTTRVVEVKLLRLTDDTTFRVCVWGNDDCGLEKDFLNEDEANFTFLKVISWNRVNKQLLKDIGFYPA
jgi:hypothetical protein